MAGDLPGRMREARGSQGQQLDEPPGERQPPENEGKGHKVKSQGHPAPPLGPQHGAAGERHKAGTQGIVGPGKRPVAAKRQGCEAHQHNEEDHCNPPGHSSAQAFLDKARFEGSRTHGIDTAEDRKISLQGFALFWRQKRPHSAPEDQTTPDHGQFTGRKDMRGLQQVLAPLAETIRHALEPGGGQIEVARCRCRTEGKQDPIAGLPLRATQSARKPAEGLPERHRHHGIRGTPPLVERHPQETVGNP